MEKRNYNEDLMSAVANHNVKAVQECLNSGADPNYSTDDDTSEIHQPTTPLKMVMFCISDCMLEDEDLGQFAKIAQLLLDSGADPVPAMQIAELRYGKYDPKAADSPFMNVWRIIANAI